MIIYVLFTCLLANCNVPLDLKAFSTEVAFCHAALSGYKDDMGNDKGYRIDLAKGTVEEVKCIASPIKLEMVDKSRRDKK